MRSPPLTAGAVVALVLSACAAPEAPSSTAPSPEMMQRAARADSVRQHYTRADVDFMTGMIHHHAQALVMSRLAESHGASRSVRTLAHRIINSQNDEIALMQRWLRERGEPVPRVDERGRVTPPDTGRGGAHAHAHDPHSATPMAGMLSAEQMGRLEAARGAEWERLFLKYMIQHHQGALVMVDELFATHGAGQSDAIFKIASDIAADQASEIDRMQRMLRDRVFGTR